MGTLRLCLATAALAWLWPGVAAQAEPIAMHDPAPDGRRVTAEGLIGNYYPAAARSPGVLLIGGSEGGLFPFVARTAVSLRDAGYSVLHLSFFGGPGQSPSLENVPLETFERGFAWMRAQPEVDGKRLAMIGASRGSEPALLLAARPPRGLRAVVAGMPSNVVWTGHDHARPTQQVGPAWTRRGKPLPAIDRPGEDVSGDSVPMFRRFLARLPERPEAAIGRPAVPVLLICGEADTLWPGCDMARAYAARAPGRTRVLAYPNAGHAVFGPPRDPGDPLIARMGAVGGTGAGNNEARADAWPKLIAFLTEWLRVR